MNNGSAYIQNLVDYLQNNNISFVTKLPTQLGSALVQYNSIILSGRKFFSKQGNLANANVIKYAVSNNLPLLGICYGAEILALVLGSTLKKRATLRRGNYTVNILKPNKLCNNSIRVHESHLYEIGTLSPKLEILGNSQECNIEIFKHKTMNIFGTQFHPEATTDGNKILDAFFK